MLTVSSELKKAARTALDCQDACNLSGVVQSLANVTKVLWQEVHAGRLRGTEDVNTHPIVKLIVNKLSSLSGSSDDYTTAYEQCELIANASTNEVPVDELSIGDDTPTILGD